MSFGNRLLRFLLYIVAAIAFITFLLIHNLNSVDKNRTVPVYFNPDGTESNGLKYVPKNKAPENTPPENRLPENRLLKNTMPENTLPDNVLPENYEDNAPNIVWTREWPTSYNSDIKPSNNLLFKIHKLIKDVSPPVFNKSSKISRIIHQTWITTRIPKFSEQWLEKWQQTNPNWTYLFWTDKSAREFISTYYKPLLNVYDSYKFGVQRADMFRYLVLFAFGGIYADLDIEPLKSLDPIRDWSPFVLSQEPEVHHQISTYGAYGNKPDLNYTLGCNAFFASRPGHPFLFYLLSRVLERSPYLRKGEKCKKNRTLWCTGPVVMTSAFTTYKRSLGQLAQQYPDDDVLMAGSRDFMPTFDPDQVGNMRAACKSAEKLAKIGKEFCEVLEKRNYSNFEYDNKTSFTVHHWIHTYNRLHIENFASVHVLDAVPHAQYFYETDHLYNMTRL